MRKSGLAVVALAVACWLALAATPRAHAEGSDGLEPVMKRMNQALKTLKKAVKDPAQQAVAEKAVQDLEASALAAKGMVPPGLSKSGAERDAAIASYRAMMMNVLRQAIDLEEAIQDKKADDAAKIIASIEDLEKQGHKEFRKEG
jgi:hypothetical protein